MKVRLMGPADLPVAARIDGLSFSAPWPPTAFGGELFNDTTRAWVAEMDGLGDLNLQNRVIAFLIIWRFLDEAHIATIAVHPDFRQLGTGTLLLKTGMRAAYYEGARLFYLEVRAGNLAAQKMYSFFGFEIVGRRPKYYKDNAEDALLMTLDLTLSNPASNKLDFLTEALDVS